MVEYNSLSFLIQTCVALACALGGIAAIGSFNCLQRKELVGDVVAHSLLPGIGAALLLVGEKAAIPFLIGAFLSGFCSIFTISWIQRSTKVGEDAALGLVIAFFFGLGLVVTSYIQRYGGEGNAGWSQQYLLGSTASITYGDMAVFVIFALLLLVLIFFCFKEWRLIVFDPLFASSIGLPVNQLRWLLQATTVLAIALGTPATGLMLVAFMITGPATAARFWSNRLHGILGLAMLFAMMSGLSGTVISYHFNVPTGPAIVLSMVFINFCSLLIAPKKGIFAKRIARYRYRRRVQEENLLKFFWELSQQAQGEAIPVSMQVLQQYRGLVGKHLARLVGSLTSQKLIKKKNGGWLLTPRGTKRGATMVRRHLLWERYLKQYLGIQKDHVHDDAESTEHLITPAIESSLEDALRLKDKP